MTLLFLVIALVLLLALNAFFVLAEFAIVKIRPSRVEELAATSDPRAKYLARIHKNMDAYLSDTQVGITFASVALGMLGKNLVGVMLGKGESAWWEYALATSFSYIFVSGGHILLGELVPKSIAIRIADKAGLRVAIPLHFFHLLFFPVVWVLNQAALAILRVLGITATAGESHSRGELDIILNQSQEHGVLSFRRLLFMENIFDFGDLTARDAMRPQSAAKCLDARATWEANIEVVRSTKHTRFPLLGDDSGKPVGFVHIKDLVIRRDAATDHDLRAIARPILTTKETTPMEQLLAEMQRRSIHMAIVTGENGRWTGLITFEDVIEELVGTIRDEFEDEEPVRLADTLRVEHIHLDLPGATPVDAVREAFGRCPKGSLPLPPDELLRAIELRERQVSTYLGHGIVMPHARIPGTTRPMVMILRSAEGVRCEGTTELGKLLFVLITPAGQPRIHQKLQSIIAIILHESEYVRERLLTADSSDEVLEVVRTGEQAVLD